MEIGSTSEQVTVTADVPLLEQRCGLGHVALLLQEWNLGIFPARSIRESASTLARFVSSTWDNIAS